MKDLIEQLDFSLDTTELLEYYHNVKTNYQDYKWTYQDNNEQVKDEFLKVYANIKKKNGYGWAITTNNLDESVKKIIPWYNISKDFNHSITELPPERNTPMVFGIVQRLLEKIPYAKCVSLSVFEPGTELVAHRDEPFLLRVHIPISGGDKSYWLNDNGYSTFKVGQVYLCDTREPHSIHNDSDTDRVHLLFAIHQDYEEEIKKLKGNI